MPINIHGKEYVTVAERLTEARAKGKIHSIITEVVPNGGAVVIKATVSTDIGVFTGISSANPNKAIEKSNPYEVAETSAVGRALGFAGFGSEESIASADEMIKAGAQEEGEKNGVSTKREDWCYIHGKEMKKRMKNDGGHWFDHRWKVGEEWKQCSGKIKSEYDERDEYVGHEGDGGA